MKRDAVEPTSPGRMRAILSSAWGRRAATAFTLFHFGAIIAFALPGDVSAFRAEVRRVVDPYLHFTGSWQYWDFFAPEPQAMVFDVEVRAEYTDGSVVTWKLPGPEGLPYFQRYRVERMRKWRESVRADEWSSIMPDAARYALHHFLRQNPEVPRRLDFVRRWHDIPPPRPGDAQPMEPLEPDHEYVFYRWPEGT